jgi:hypothetical protein
MAWARHFVGLIINGIAPRPNPAKMFKSDGMHKIAKIGAFIDFQHKQHMHTTTIIDAQCLLYLVYEEVYLTNIEA